MTQCNRLRTELRAHVRPASERLLVFVQRELTTREYDRTIQVPTGKKTFDYVIQQLKGQLKADMVRWRD